LNNIHPGYFLPTVAGSLIGGQGAAAFGLTTLGWMSFGVGVLSGLLFGTIIVNRLFVGTTLPDALDPPWRSLSRYRRWRGTPTPP
jgi:tellurite resistance protein